MNHFASDHASTFCISRGIENVIGPGFGATGPASVSTGP